MENHKELLKTKILCCYDMHGDPNWQYLEFLHVLNDWFLRHREDYIGLAPYGSQVKGYANETSDYDIVLFAGDGLVQDEEKLQQNINAIAKRFGKKGNSPHIRGVHFFVGNFTIDREEHPGTSYSDPLKFLLYPCIGKVEKIEEFRELARKKHSYHLEHHRANARENVRDTVWSQIMCEFNVRLRYRESVRKQLREGETSQKMISRGFTLQELESIVKYRQELWLNKCNAFLSGKPDEERVPC